ncbi:MAG: CBS domain-containing protein [Candidatus Omnitrophota bacterium]
MLSIDKKTNGSARIFIYFSQLMDREVVDKNARSCGQLYDIIVKPTQVYPQSSHLIIREGYPNRKYAVLAWPDIEEIGEREIRLKLEKSKLIYKEQHNNKEELTLRRDILDQQVVDTANHKVIRVNDIHLLEVDHCLMIAHVDISFRGLIRRLGFEKVVDFLVALVHKNAGYLKYEQLISWKHIQPLSINPVSMTIKIDVPQKQFSNIPAADLADIFLDLNSQHQLVLFKSLDLSTRSRIFRGIDFRAQKSLVEEMQPKEVAEILNSLPADEATDFLEKIPADVADKFLNLMESKQAKRLSQLLGYSSDSAGGLMTNEYMAFHKDAPVESVLAQIKVRVFKTEPAQFVYIVDEVNHLVGATNFRRMMLAVQQGPIQNAAFPKTYCVHLSSSVKEVAYLMDKYKYYVIPVVDENNYLQGIITVDDILSQLISFAWRKVKKIKAKAAQ